MDETGGATSGSQSTGDDMWWAQLVGIAGNAWAKSQSQGAGGGMMATPSNLSNGGNAYSADNWTVATSGGKATTTSLPSLTPLTAGVLIVGGLLLWKKKKA